MATVAPIAGRYELRALLLDDGVKQTWAAYDQQLDRDVSVELLTSADADPNIVAAFLHGSRAVGHERPDSDYDVWFVTAEERALEEIQNVEAASDF